MVTTRKPCYGEYNAGNGECYTCPQRVECMVKKFENTEPYDEWGGGDKPNCFGAYKGRSDCIDCPYNRECSKTAVQLRKGKHKIRISGKYKSRGKEIAQEDF